MINVPALKGKMVEKEITGAEMAKILNMTDKTFYKKLNKGIFTNLQIDIMLEVLEINDPRPIFFSQLINVSR